MALQADVTSVVQSHIFGNYLTFSSQIDYGGFN